MIKTVMMMTMMATTILVTTTILMMTMTRRPFSVGGRVQLLPSREEALDLLEKLTGNSFMSDANPEF